MTDPKDLKARIEAARQAQEPDVKSGGAAQQASGAAAAFGHSIGMVAALVVGGGIGLFVDNLLGTGPWALLIFLVLGMAAGFLNIVRAAQGMAARAQADYDAQSAPDKK